jgi:hypothetical protein
MLINPSEASMYRPTRNPASRPPSAYRYSRLATLLVGVALFASGCVIEETVGPPGPPGFDGRDGRDGNANVFSVNFDFDMADATINDAVASVGYEVDGITESVVDEGAVLVYFREQGTWTAMPYTFAFERPDEPVVDYTISLGYGYDDFFLEVFYEASTPEAPLADQPTREMKAVIIDGFPRGKTLPFDPADYEQVAAFYGLRDEGSRTSVSVAGR